MRRIASEARSGDANITAGTRIGTVAGTDVLRSFYRGLMPNMLGNSVSWALYFLFYGNIKDLLRTFRSTTAPSTKLGKQALSSSDYFLASGLAGILTAVLTNPIWVIKTRMLSTARHTPGAYKSHQSRDGRSLPHGGTAGFLPRVAAVITRRKPRRNPIHGLRTTQKPPRPLPPRGLEIGTHQTSITCTSSALSKMFAGSITYPYQVVRARLQTYDAQVKYKGAWDVVVKVWGREGVGGFYKGLGPNLVRVLPSTCVTFLVYENTKFYLPRVLGGEAVVG